MRIKDIYKGDRPREKLFKLGADKLMDNELLAIIISSGTKDKNAIELSKILLKNKSVSFFNTIEIENLLKVNGIGKAIASRILSTIELANRIKDKKKIVIYSPKDIWIELNRIKNNKKEHFFVFCLDSRNSIIKKELVSVGTLNSSLVHPREVFEPAIRNLSAQLVIAHNHPSGDVNPSKEDLKITAKLAKAGELLGISIVDHVIISGDIYFSFKGHNFL